MKEISLDIFPKVNKDEWINLAKKQLKGEDPIQTLSWLSDSQLEMNSYYDQSDIEGFNKQIEFFKSLKPFHWKLYENIDVRGVASGNREALEALAGGCNGVIFSIQERIDFKVLLDNILIDICDVSLQSSIELEDVPQLSGFLIGGNLTNAIDASEGQKNQVDIITSTLKTITNEKHVLRNASSDFFLEVASLRALRFLLFDLIGEKANQIQIHTSILPHSSEDQQWFVNSTAGLASILGGSTSINFYTAKGNSRISRNVGNIIREECGIIQYEDQCGGSFFVEALTHKIIQACKENLEK